MKDTRNMTSTHDANLPPSLFTLATATQPYAVIVEGNLLAPRYFDGDTVAISPAVDSQEAITPGSLVLVALQNARIENAYDRAGLFLANGDGDLTAGSQFIERGQYILLGVEMPQN